MAAEGDESAAKEQLANTACKLADLQDQVLRAHAELENTRKRSGKEIERVRKYAIEALAVELLIVKDNLERGLENEAQTQTVEIIREGVQLTLRSLEQVFAKFGIEEISPQGQTFDPELHQAMSTMDSDEHPPNTVAVVVQKGYMLRDRLLRPAMVVVTTRQDGKGGEAE